jgi:alkane 1-monooxygenase
MRGSTEVIRRHLSPFFFYTPLVVTVAAWYVATVNHWNNSFVYAALIYVFGVISLLDIAVGPTTEGTYEPLSTRELESRAWLYQAIALSCVPVFALSIWWGCYVYSTHDFTLIEKIAWALSLGVLTTIVAHTPAHELIHKNHPFVQAMGGCLFSLGLYGGAKVSHIRSHHVWVATPGDPTTAKRGQSLYGFLPGAIWVNTWGAWKIQMRLLAQHKSRFVSARNEMLVWTLISVAVLVLIYRAYGTETVIFYLGQCFVGIVTLEAINYAEHYGLERKRTVDGSYERVSLRHAWNCDFIFNNLIALNAERHADHHKHAARDYQLLRSFAESPQLPQGYTVLVFFVLIPPLWRWYIHPHLDQVAARPVASLEENWRFR